MNWVKKCKLSAIEAIKFNRHSYIKLNEFWQVLYQMFNLAQDQCINFQLLNEITFWPQSKWLPFFKAEITNTIKKCSGLSTPGPNHISQIHFKILVTDNKYITNFVNMANSCINLSH